MNHNLVEENRKIENAMVFNAKEKLEMHMESNDEHSLQFSMYIKRTFGTVYNYISDNPPPFEIYLQQSAYVISAALVSCIFKETPLRDLVRNKDSGLKKQLNWNIKLPQPIRTEDGGTTEEDRLCCLIDEMCSDTNTNHTRMFNLVSTIISEYDCFESLRTKDIGCFQGIINKTTIKEYDDFLYIVGYNLGDAYLHSIYDYLVMYRKHLEYCEYAYPATVNNRLLRRNLNRLLVRGTVEDIVESINKESAFMRDQKSADESLKDMWLLSYITDIIGAVDGVSCFNGQDYGITATMVDGTEETKNELDAYIKEASVLRPTSLPIIRKPLDWDIGDTEGGFHHIDAPLVPAKKAHHLFPEKPYLNALNKIQSTSFRINKNFFELVKKAGFEIESHKRKPVGWSKERYKRYKKSIESKNRDVKRIVSIADDYVGYDEFWFTMYCDFRYRMYYRQEYLSPQGQDLSKALLEFSIGMPVNKTALRWMKINIANLGGEDDKTYRMRVRWVGRNEKAIRAMVDDPTSKSAKKLLANADKPWQFLAACVDYVMYLDNPKTHLSHLPVGMDGKCNGTQHWCAMLRDRVGGSKVALVNTEVPSDLYTEVLENLLKLLDVQKSKVYVESTPDHEKKIVRQKWAISWLDSGGLKRKLVKTPTMTTTYSAGKKAFRGYVKNFCIDNGIVFSEEDSIQNQHVNYMVDEIINAIDRTVSAKSGMRFVQDCVKGKDEVHVRSPLGAHVYMSPKRTFKREFKVRIDGKMRNVTFSYDGTSTDHLAIHTGISPNFIHMMDATHMAMTVNGCPQISHWMMIHDQYSCHAYYVDDMQKGIRVSFADLYRIDRLAEFREQQGLTEADVPLPKYGDWCVDEVLDSDYFFS